MSVMESKANIAVYPGTFDPITNGHLDIIKRARPLFSRIFVTLALNSEKKPLFTVEERLEVGSFNGLVVDFAQSIGATTIIRGLRAVSDFEYEFLMALMNRKQRPSIDTVFLMPDERYTYLSSSIVREVARHGGDVSCFVPRYVSEMLAKRFATESAGGH